MADFLDTIIFRLNIDRLAVKDYLDRTASHLNNAGGLLRAHLYDNAGQALGDAAQDLSTFSDKLSQDNASSLYNTRQGFILIQDNWGGEINMGMILTAMYEATNDELLNFIGLVDAYRQSLWNKPFNAEFFAAIARGFEEWEY